MGRHEREQRKLDAIRSIRMEDIVSPPPPRIVRIFRAARKGLLLSGALAVSIGIGVGAARFNDADETPLAADAARQAAPKPAKPVRIAAPLPRPRPTPPVTLADFHPAPEAAPAVAIPTAVAPAAAAPTPAAIVHPVATSPAPALVGPRPDSVATLLNAAARADDPRPDFVVDAEPLPRMDETDMASVEPDLVRTPRPRPEDEPVVTGSIARAAPARTVRHRTSFPACRMLNRVAAALHIPRRCR